MNRRDMAKNGSLAALVAVATGLGFKLAQADDTGDVLTAIEEYRKAMIDANGPRLNELSHDDMSFGHAGGVVQTKVEFIKTVVEKSEIFKSIKLYDHSIKLSGDLAIARHVFDAFIFYQGKDNNFLLNVVQVWKKEAGRWKLLVRQAYKLPS